MSDFNDDIAGVTRQPSPGASDAPPPPKKRFDLDAFDAMTGDEAPTKSESVFNAEALEDTARIEAEAKAKAVEAAAKTGALLKKGVLAGASVTAKLAGEAATKAKETDPALRKKIGLGLAIAVALGLVGAAVHITLEGQRDFAQEEKEAGLGFEPIPGDAKERYATRTEELAFGHAVDARRAWIEDRFGPDQDPPSGAVYAWTRVVLKGGGWDYCLMRQRDKNASWASEPDEFDFDEFKSCVTKLADGSPLVNAIIDREGRWTSEQQTTIVGALEELCRGEGAGWQVCTNAINAPDLPWRNCRDQQDPEAFKIAPFKACVRETIVQPATVNALLTIGSACDRSLGREERGRCEAFVEAHAETLPAICAKDIEHGSLGEITSKAVTNCVTAKWEESERVPEPEPEPAPLPPPPVVEPPAPEPVKPVAAEPVRPMPAAPAPVVREPAPERATAVPRDVAKSVATESKPKADEPVRTVVPKPTPKPVEKSAEEIEMERWFQQLEDENSN